jgi:hypothetical protein
MTYSKPKFNMANSEVIYVKVPGNNNCMYPTYIPIVMKEPEVYRSTGKLSLGDYQSTVDNLGGNPALIPLIAALAPLIPAAIKGVKKLFNKSDNKPKYRNVGSYGYGPYGYGPYGYGPYGYGPYGYGPYSQRGYHGFNENTYYKGGYPRVAPFNVGGYIPTNPNIKNLKDLQALYDKYE